MRRRRSTARVLPVDREGRVLLLHGWDPLRPRDPFWFTIGGAVEHGGTLPEADARELWEGAGIVVAPGTPGGPVCAGADRVLVGRHALRPGPDVLRHRGERRRGEFRGPGGA